MKDIKLLMSSYKFLKFDNISSIPNKLIEEAIQSEINSSLKNNNTYWDNFGDNIQRANILKAQIEKCRSV